MLFSTEHEPMRPRGPYAKFTRRTRPVGAHPDWREPTPATVVATLFGGAR